MRPLETVRASAHSNGDPLEGRAPGTGKLAACLEVLRHFAAHPEDVPSQEYKDLITAVYRNARIQRRKAGTAKRRDHDRKIIQASTRFRMETTEARPLPSEAGDTLQKVIKCHICKQGFTRVHHFYHMLCPACAEHNFTWRNRTTDLTGRKALLTGGRLKIGYQTALKLLRAGAEVLVTTGFPA